MTAIPTSIDRAVDTPVPAGGLRAVGIAGGLGAVALAGASLGADELVAGELGPGRRSSRLWGLAAVVVALRTSAPLGRRSSPGRPWPVASARSPPPSADLTRGARGGVVPHPGRRAPPRAGDPRRQHRPPGPAQPRHRRLRGRRARRRVVMVVGDRIPAVPAVAPATTARPAHRPARRPPDLPALHRAGPPAAAARRLRGGRHRRGRAGGRRAQRARRLAEPRRRGRRRRHRARARSRWRPARARASRAASTGCSCTRCRPPGSPPWSWRCTS